MPELLLELFTEEIPAGMQARAAEDLRSRVGSALDDQHLSFRVIESFSTPRRLAMIAGGLAPAQPDTVEERRGPRVGAPDAALNGFLKSVGLHSLDGCERRDTGKGVFWFASIPRAGRTTREILPDVLSGVIADFPWPKSMRWASGSLRWVRPLARILCLLDGTILPLQVESVETVDYSSGHRFLAPERFRVANAAHYRTELAQRHVTLERDVRRNTIEIAATALAEAAGAMLAPDEALLEEVTGLVEMPFLKMGAIEPDFMTMPPEVLTTSMRSHQKYFACLKPDTAAGQRQLAPCFIFAANVPGDDGGVAIVAGNERVLRARLSDARFFWEQDRRTRLEDRVPALSQRSFHARLGSVLDKVQRMATLVPMLAHAIPGVLVVDALRAVRLAKADLSCGMVGEFPELQGIMGRYYALGEGEPASIADAIAEHYAPAGPAGSCPTAPVSVTVALADRLDSLVGFFSIGERPTGSKDPFALRRAALGAIRLILENGLRLPLSAVLTRAAASFPEASSGLVGEVLTFMAERLKVDLRSDGLRHDLIAAALSEGSRGRAMEDDFVRLVVRAKSLQSFIGSAEGADLLTAYRRAANIVRIEERRDGRSYEGKADPALFEGEEEAALHHALEVALASVATAMAGEDFGTAMAALAALRDPVDSFFERVTVNAEQPDQRVNRLALLSQIRGTLDGVADFSKIEG